MAGAPDNKKDRSGLSEAQYEICWRKGTEPAFSGKYHDCHDSGTYHCVCCDAPLFSSDDKFDSGTGWPSFTRSIKEGHIRLSEDNSHHMVRTEACCGQCGAHLGHVFPDGPPPTGMRYCINSLALNLK